MTDLHPERLSSLDLPDGMISGIIRYQDLSTFDLPEPSISWVSSQGTHAHAWLFTEPVDSRKALPAFRRLHPSAELHGWEVADGGRTPRWPITSLGLIWEFRDLEVALGVRKERKPRTGRQAIAATLRRDMERLIDHLFAGDGTRQDQGGRVRFGSKGSLSIDPATGEWYSFEASRGGGPLELIEFLRGCSKEEAVAEGKRLTEGVELAEPEPSVTIEERKAKRAAKLEAAQVEGRVKVEEYRRSYNVVHPVRGVALRYLESRGIKPTDVSGLPIMFKPLAPKSKSDWRAAACVFAATTADGHLQALQFVRIDEDGRKITTIRDPKKTAGCRHGAAVRFRPYGLSRGPLFICDGPEDALSLCLHGRVEAWATLGGLGEGVLDLGIPTGRRVVLAADNDEPGSAADRGLRAACIALNQAGHPVGVLRTPQEFKDVNEMLLARGPGAVAELVKEVD